MLPRQRRRTAPGTRPSQQTPSTLSVRLGSYALPVLSPCVQCIAVVLLLLRARIATAVAKETQLALNGQLALGCFRRVRLLPFFSSFQLAASVQLPAFSPTTQPNQPFLACVTSSPALSITQPASSSSSRRERRSSSSSLAQLLIWWRSHACTLPSPLSHAPLCLVSSPASSSSSLADSRCWSIRCERTIAL